MLGDFSVVMGYPNDACREGFGNGQFVLECNKLEVTDGFALKSAERAWNLPEMGRKGSLLA